MEKKEILDLLSKEGYCEDSQAVKFVKALFDKFENRGRKCFLEYLTKHELLKKVEELVDGDTQLRVEIYYYLRRLITKLIFFEENPYIDAIIDRTLNDKDLSIQEEEKKWLLSELEEVNKNIEKAKDSESDSNDTPNKN